MVQRYYLGKLAARHDNRTIPWSRIKTGLVAPPSEYDVDVALGGLTDANMYGNDKYGDCVIAGRGHMTLRFEKHEQDVLIPITDSDIENEYFKETGGPDSGLVMLTSLNDWRQGWPAAGKTYNIYAFAALDVKQQAEVQDSIYFLNGCYSGIQVPQSAMDQFNAGQVWDVVANDGGIVGGHCIYLVAYNTTGPVCVTWGKRQQMTWAFWLRYADEAYGVIDNIDVWMNPATDPVNVQALNSILAEITASPVPANPEIVYTVKIQDISTFSPIVGATVTVNSLPSVVTDSTGTAVIHNVPPGNDTVSVNASGYLPMSTVRSFGMAAPNPSSVFSMTPVPAPVPPIPTPPPSPPEPTPSSCKAGNGVASMLNKLQQIRGRKGRFYYLNPPEKKN